jgi:ATP-binding cassette subfamily B protein
VSGDSSNGDATAGGISDAAPGGIPDAAPGGIPDAAPGGIPDAAPGGISDAAPDGIPDAAPGGIRARIRDWRRLAGVLVGTGFEAAPWVAAGCLVLGTVAAVCSVTYTLGLRVMIDGAIAGSLTRILIGAGLVSVLFTLSWLLAVIGGSQNSLLTDRVSLALAVRIARLSATLPTLEHFESARLLDRVDRLTAGRRTLAGAPRQLIGLFGQALRAVGMVVLLATVYLPVLLVPLLALAPALADRRAARVQSDADRAITEDRRLLEQLFWLATTASSARELRTYGITGPLAERHRELSARVRRRAVRAALQSALWEGLGWLVFALGLVAAIVALVLRAAHGHISPGSVVMAVTLMRRAQTQISRSTDTAGSFATSVSAARELLWLEDREQAAAARRRSRAAVPRRLERGISIQRLEFSYPGGDGEPALGPLDLELPAGSTVALVGENGAGKTTLVKLLCGMYAPGAGRILVDGIDLSELDPAAWRARISAAFQDFVRFNLVLRESVGVGDLGRIEDLETVRDALHRSDSGALEGRLADGLQTRVGTRFTAGRELSGGEWQRLALARGLMRTSPLLVVLDEPTASVDAPSESALFQRYAQAARTLAAANGTITLLVSHRFSTARSADLIVFLERGRVVEVGSHAELIARGGTYAELFSLQAAAYA